MQTKTKTGGQPYESPRVGGPTIERVWTMVAADRDGVVATDLIGRRKQERVAVFAFRAEAEAWLQVQKGDGWEPEGPTPIAMRFFGETDSPANAWSVRATRVLP